VRIRKYKEIHRRKVHWLFNTNFSVMIRKSSVQIVGSWEKLQRKWHYIPQHCIICEIRIYSLYSCIFLLTKLLNQIDFGFNMIIFMFLC